MSLIYDKRKKWWIKSRIMIEVTCLTMLKLLDVVLSVMKILQKLCCPTPLKTVEKTQDVTSYLKIPVADGSIEHCKASVRKQRARSTRIL